ncbi:pyridoxal phosphate-dependent aminotransferase [Achromobacter sp. SIMBA_011]|jgi:aspartate/methionine/tyrosine aminotransferase|uniref:Aspartate aminotransferase n=1 Tax=Achromobacter dolens TaxID=1287738 RepID=A0A6S7DBX7_9BURK|nr:pyridoxal phosphate-dependent aminotransferase [Achromobacter dolens]MBQ2646079.1 pyridoxal phosphate-dependent aminotransferase [Achromobacter sp.]OAS84769.1 aminotransferase [Achromobacter xylosoxidans]CAB3704727.1 Aspartate aminotransferase [Achromobacter dolens]CAB3869271.1 Aspartate aminotransferase [Achromobacter dolens]CUI55653.1 Aspartate aminotransferase [Achromobacter dolens]
MPRLAARTNDFLTFQVVELFKQAQALQAAGKDIISLGIGEPDFTAPPQVVEALQRAAQAGQSGYSAPAGLMPLREAIARFYHEQFGAVIDPRRVIVTAGASGALTLACAALVNPGAQVLMPDPSYPANSNFVLAAGGQPRLIPSSAEKRFQLSAQDVARHWTEATQGVLVASPSNPTGTSIDHDELSRLLAEVRARHGFAIVDEIYLGLSYEGRPRSALTLDDDIIVINSFSKYFHMTGWRLGWMIVPEAMVAPVEKIAGSLAICAPTLAQHAALACFTPDALRTFEHRREAFRQRRDYLLPEFERLGLKVPVKPDGAFYIYADISDLASDSAAFSQRLLLEAGIAAVPGLDFGPAHGHHTMRFSYATGLDRLEEAVARLGRLLGR